MVRFGPKVDRVNTTGTSTLERALGLVIQNEARRQGLTHKEIQRRSGITDRTFRRYFVAAERSIPVDEVVKVAAVLQMPASALFALAEEEAQHLAARELRGTLKPSEVAELDAAIERTRRGEAGAVTDADAAQESRTG